MRLIEGVRSHPSQMPMDGAPGRSGLVEEGGQMLESRATVELLPVGKQLWEGA